MYFPIYYPLPLSQEVFICRDNSSKSYLRIVTFTFSFKGEWVLLPASGRGLSEPGMLAIFFYSRLRRCDETRGISRGRRGLETSLTLDLSTLSRMCD